MIYLSRSIILYYFPLSLRTFQHSASFFADIYGRIDIAVHAVSAYTGIDPLIQTQFFFDSATDGTPLARRIEPADHDQAFSSVFQLIRKHLPELPESIIHHILPEMQASAHRFHIDVFYCYSIVLLRDPVTQLMLEVFSLVPHLLMTEGHAPLLFIIIPAALPAP